MSVDRLDVGLYGMGHFGYAMMRHLEPKTGDRITLRGYDKNETFCATLRDERRHPLYAAPQPLSPEVLVVASPEELLDGLDVLILAVNSSSTREVAQRVADAGWNRPLVMVNTAKALDFKTGRRLSQIVTEVIDDPPQRLSYVALAGGTIASEMLLQNPLGLTLASNDHDALEFIKPIFVSPNLWIQLSADLVGVEHAGAFKNVISICAGMVRGLGLSYGAETHLISRMADEVETFCVRRLGAVQKTFSIGSQCWGSDLWMSCTGDTRNRALGELLGQGKSLDEANRIMAEQNKTVEGVQTLRALKPLIEQYPDDLRLVGVADRVVMHDLEPQALLDALMRD